MILELVESDKPKTIGEKIAEFMARPPQPILKFYGGFSVERNLLQRHLAFAVRNGVPLPLLYGIYIKVSHDARTEYIEKTDHIGPFSIDDWRLSYESVDISDVEITVGLVPFEITTDRVRLAV